jgi:hypothetical protein
MRGAMRAFIGSLLAALAVVATLFCVELWGSALFAYYLWLVVGSVLVTLTLWLLLVVGSEP